MKNAYLNGISYFGTKEENEYYMTNYKLFVSVDDLFQPIGKKDCWDNCAYIIAGFCDEDILKYRERIFQWFQDLNWPGVNILWNRLLKLDKAVLLNCINEALAIAKQEKDELWEYGLKELKKLAENGKSLY